MSEVIIAGKNMSKVKKVSDKKKITTKNIIIQG